MATLTVWKFDEVGGAGDTLATIQDLQQQELIQIRDAAIVTWPADKKKPKTKQLHNLAGAGALSGAFWGWFFGILFWAPIRLGGWCRRRGALGFSERCRYRRRLH